MVKRRVLSPKSKRKSVLIYCEGKEDQVFIQYLKSQFVSPEINVIIKKGNGNANSILDKTARFCFRGVYDAVVCFYDTDKGVDPTKKDNCRKACGEHTTYFVENEPCLEAFLLQILEGKDYSSYSDCGDLKTKFENNYINSEKRKNPDSYTKHFPKSLLTRRAHQIPDLQLLIDVISGKNLK